MYSTEGIVLKEKDFGEADRFFTLFTKDFGKIKVMAKGVRKIKAKLRGGLQLFHYIYLEFVQGKYFYTAIEAVNINTFLTLRNEPEKLKALFYISELLAKLVKEERDERIWLLFLKIFKKMEESKFSGSRLELLLRYFEWNLLDILGYHPELYNCVNCGVKLREGKPPHHNEDKLPKVTKLTESVPVWCGGKLYFSAGEGGILCGFCKNKDREAREIELDAIKILRLILGRKKEILEKLKINIQESGLTRSNFLEQNLDGLKKITQYYLQYLLEEKIEPV
ncbi:MAG: DNA repair protein RecO [Gammaproteobacteria bacterium CG22_combo_CG10-13_8_21_14_all_40_8]|nr:MAG: DNA repair protein RecO [Gammaproteobacteria bacterium CG22_combo_CG10-13_8_21_14_all_40_8]PIQ92544.1 MAG: DNA repair protein RecO [Parcubacteria group bacterium CG11_big_fil_rev_8_21_14_0_20_39_14]PIS35301.1 MAG: DNA repair protein RecO [Parcubacteria group bacterium CG08_land_8_20_14_0_20_38_56]